MDVFIAVWFIALVLSPMVIAWVFAPTFDSEEES